MHGLQAVVERAKLAGADGRRLMGAVLLGARQVHVVVRIVDAAELRPAVPLQKVQHLGGVVYVRLDLAVRGFVAH